MRLLRRPAPTSRSTDLHAEFAAAWDRLEIHAQDIDSTTDGSLFATEALLRWRRNPNELWAAAMVLPIAEETGTAEDCTRWATELTLATWATSESRLHGGRLAINLHSSQLARPDIADELAADLSRNDLAADELLLEVPDRLGPTGCREAVERLGPLVDAGARLALDDHRGTASSTDPTPDWLPQGSVVKLDPALVMAVDEPTGLAILEMTADRLHALGYEIVATDIERPAQLAAVIDCHIAWAQGFLFATPTALR